MTFPLQLELYSCKDLWDYWKFLLNSVRDASSHEGEKHNIERKFYGICEGGKAVGVRIARNPRKKYNIRAKKAVISNASLWNTQQLLPNDAISKKWKKEAAATNMTGSFMHLHLGLNLRFCSTSGSIILS